MNISDQVKEDEVGGACSTHGRIEKCIKILVGKTEGKGPLWRFRRRWEYNIRMYLRERGSEGVNWMHLAQDRGQWWALVNSVMNLRFLWKAGNFWT